MRITMSWIAALLLAGACAAPDGNDNSQLITIHAVPPDAPPPDAPARAIDAPPPTIDAPPPTVDATSTNGGGSGSGSGPSCEDARMD